MSDYLILVFASSLIMATLMLSLTWYSIKKGWLPFTHLGKWKIRESAGESDGR